MLLSRLQYNQRKRFDTQYSESLDTFCRKIELTPDTIFMAYTWNGKIRYVKIVAELAQIHFDIYQCNPKGEPIRYGYRKAGVHKNEIAERLFEGDWKIYKKPNME